MAGIGKHRRWAAWACMGWALLASGCQRGGEVAPGEAVAHPATAEANAGFAQRWGLDLSLDRDMAEASRGLVARPEGQIRDAQGRLLRDFGAYRFLGGPAPATVNPSLWRHAQLNAQIGLFKVTEGIWQLRGFDIANITLVQGQRGWIVIDALTARESAAAAMAFARQHLGDRPVTALVYTHSHADHFGGVLGVISAEEAQRRQVPIVAPQGFVEEATSENVLVGTAMARRSFYQFGKELPRSVLGNVDTGLGKDVVYGQLGLLLPTRLITRPDEELELDGVRFVFHNVPGAEAPAELSFSIPALKAYGGAENLAQTQHILLPVRGAKVRDALRWSQYLQQALDQLGDAEVYFGQHNWPIWGRERIAAFIRAQRDVYKYTHDQTVRLINAGLTPAEIAERVQLPASLQTHLGARGYYGDLRHNVKAVYQHYLGAYDGNPAHLDPLPPQALAARYVAALGGAQQVMTLARQAHARGDFRWAVELLNHLVFSDAGHGAARELLARCYEQLGYVAESATWRNSYLTAAQELRNGPPRQGVDRQVMLEVLRRTPIERFLEAMAAGLDGPAAEGRSTRIKLVFSDLGQSYLLWLENAVLHHRAATPADEADATLTLTQDLFVALMAGTAGAKDLLMSRDLTVEGSRVELIRFLALIDKAPGTFPIVHR